METCGEAAALTFSRSTPLLPAGTVTLTFAARTGRDSLLTLGCDERLAVRGAAERLLGFARIDGARAFCRRLEGFAGVAPRVRAFMAGFALLRRAGRFDPRRAAFARFRARFNVRLASLNVLRATFN